MKHAAIICVVVLAAARLTQGAFGYDLTFQIAMGAISVMALAIAATFLWLWRERATPLALGMAFSWGGTASVMGWFCVYEMLDKPPALTDHPALFGFLSLSITGALLHFAVIHRSVPVIPLRPAGAVVVLAATLSLMSAVYLTL